MAKFTDEITSPGHVGETWNECYECGHAWKDVPVKGVIYRLRLCEKCKNKIKEAEKYIGL